MGKCIEKAQPPDAGKKVRTVQAVEIEQEGPAPSTDAVDITPATHSDEGRKAESAPLLPPVEVLPPPLTPAERATQGLLHVASVAGARPASREEAKELLARAVGEMALQRSSLRRLRKLMRDKNAAVAKATWTEVLAFLRETKQDGGSGKPIQIQLNSFVARPQ